MTEQEAHQAITAWAKNYFAENEEHITPEVEIESLELDADEEEWTAELEVSTSADNPTVTFFMSSQRGYGLQIAAIEYYKARNRYDRAAGKMDA